MINIVTSPVNLSNSFADLVILMRLSVRLWDHNDLFSISIKQAIRENKPTSLIINTVKDAIIDNRGLIEPKLGKSLTDKILVS